MMSSYSVFSPIKSFCVNWLQERFVVTAFISHSLDGKLRQQFKALSLRIRFATHTEKKKINGSVKHFRNSGSWWRRRYHSDRLATYPDRTVASKLTANSSSANRRSRLCVCVTSATERMDATSQRFGRVSRTVVATPWRHDHEPRPLQASTIQVFSLYKRPQGRHL